MVLIIPRTADFALQKVDEVSYVQIWMEAGDIARILLGKELRLKRGDRALLYVWPFKVDMSADCSHAIPCPLTFSIDQVL